MSVFGIISVHHGIETSFDLRNYHFHNPWSVLNNRLHLDVAPAKLQSYFNPTLDFLLYWLIVYFNDWPRVIAFCMGALDGINVFLIIQIARHVFLPAQCYNIGVFWSLVALAVALGATGAAVTPLIGTTTGDLKFSLFVLAALLIVIRVASDTPPKYRRILETTAGFLVGLAVALKLVAVIYVLGISAAFVLAAYRDLLMAAARFAAGFLAGVLVGGGWFFWLLYEHFGNPFFPLFNNVFRSPYAELLNYSQSTRLPTTLTQWLLYPFYWAFAPTTYVSWTPFRDPRIATLLLLCGAALLFVILKKAHQPDVDRADHAKIELLSSRGLLIVGVFCAASYASWLVAFSLYRYLVVIEMLSGILIVGLLAYLLRDPVRTVLASAVCTALIIRATLPLYWEHGPIGERYIAVTLPHVPANSVVVQTDFFTPLAYLLPFMNPTARFVKFDGKFLNPTHTNLLVQRARLLIDDKTRALFTIRRADQDPSIGERSYRVLGVTESTCTPIQSNWDNKPLVICALVRSDLQDD
jgi:hypothetical protein